MARFVYVIWFGQSLFAIQKEFSCRSIWIVTAKNCQKIIRKSVEMVSKFASASHRII